MVVESWTKDYAVSKDEKTNGTFITYHERMIYSPEVKKDKPKEQQVV